MNQPLEKDVSDQQGALFEQQAVHLETELFEGKENADKTTATIAAFVASCNLRGDKPLEQWLSDEFRKHPDIWNSEAELLETTSEIIRSTGAFNRSRESLQQHLDKGRSKESWIANELEKNAELNGATSVGEYASSIDQALTDANISAEQMITTKAGTISRNPNLDGFIAEHHHAETFNIDATAKGSPYRARVVNSRELNSVDIEIVDGNGQVVDKYQSKYGANAKATERQLAGGDYEGQKRLVPEGQSADIPDSTDVIDVDGVQSKPLSKEEAKALQEKAQQEAEARQYDWNDTSRIDIARQIGKQALLGACITAGMQGARILARRGWNWLNGRENPAASEDLKEFFDSSLKSSGNVAAQVAVSGGLVVAVKNGWLGSVVRGTPAGLIANIACVGLQNAKTLYKLGKGELGGREALDAIGNTTVTTAMAIATATKGAAIGAAYGTVFGPLGTAVGGFAGGLAGGIASSAIGEHVYKAGKAVVKTAVTVAGNIVKGVGKVAESAGRALKSVGNAIVSFFS